MWCSRNPNFLPILSVDICFGAVKALENWSQLLDETEIKHFGENVKAIITKIFQKLLEHSSLE